VEHPKISKMKQISQVLREKEFTPKNNKLLMEINFYIQYLL